MEVTRRTWTSYDVTLVERPPGFLEGPGVSGEVGAPSGPADSP